MKKNNKNIAILTFSYSENSGSLLQTFALQRTIQQLLNNECGEEGGKCYIVNYDKVGALKPTFFVNVFYPPISEWNKSQIKKWLHRIKVFTRYISKHNLFRKKYLNLTKKYTRKSLKKLNDYFGYFIVGSDQVWNCKSPKVDGSFFLDFVIDDKKKNSYAASFGATSMISENIDNVGNLLSKFNHVSVREKSGIDIYQSVTNKKAELVLDPTLLLTKKEWEHLTIAPSIDKKYIVLYLLEANDIIEKIVSELNRNREYVIVRLWRSRLVDDNGNDIKIVGPQEWMGYIKNASYIFTNSFHGICFSIIFHKEFYVALRKNTNDSRLIDFLREYSLEDRILNSEMFFYSIDYSLVDKKIEEMRKASLNYLETIIKE